MALAGSLPVGPAGMCLASGHAPGGKPSYNQSGCSPRLHRQPVCRLLYRYSQRSWRHFTVSATTLAPALTETTAPVYGQTALKHLVALSETIGSRQPGRPASQKPLSISNLLSKKLGYQTSLQPFTIQTPVTLAGIQQCNRNQNGSIDQVILVGAHYDSVSAGKGADDNAPG